MRFEGKDQGNRVRGKKFDKPGHLFASNLQPLTTRGVRPQTPEEPSALRIPHSDF